MNVKSMTKLVTKALKNLHLKMGDSYTKRGEMYINVEEDYTYQSIKKILEKA